MKVMLMRSAVALSVLLKKTLGIGYLVLSLLLYGCSSVATGTDSGSLPPTPSQYVTQTTEQSEGSSSVCNSF